MLGLTEESNYYYQILQNKYPASDWAAYAQKLLD